MEFSDCTCREFMEKLPEAVFLETLDGDILEVNKEVCDLLGYEREELLELTVDELVPEGAPAFLPDRIDEATRSGEPIETVNIRKDGTEVPVELRGKIVEVEGEARMLISIRGISERKRVQKELKLAKFSLDNASLEVFWVTPEGAFTYVNKTTTRHLGYSEEELLEMNVADLDPNYPEDRREEHWKELKDKGRMRFESVHEKKDGTRVPVEITDHYLEFKGREYEFAFAQDISERKEAKQELKRKGRAVESSLSGVAIANLEGELEYINPSFLRIWGYEVEEKVIGRDVTEFWAKEEKAIEVMKSVKETGKWSGELLAEKKDGATFHVQALASVVTDDQDNPIAMMSSFIDITERKRTQQALVKERTKLINLHEAVDELQDQDTEEDVLRTAVEATEDMLDFQLCTIATLEGDYLVPKATSAHSEPEEAATFEIGEGIAGKTVQKGETIWCEDVREHPEAKPTSEEFRALISVPIEEIGSLQVASKEVGGFTEQDVELAEILAGHLREELNRVRLEEDLRQQAIHDPLTGLYNRRYFNETLKKEVQQAERYNKTLAFLMADVDRFKEVNDRYTHQTGDEVLKEVANLLVKDVRDADTVVRYGGDEFLIMMPETNGELKNVTERLKENLAQWNEKNDLLDFPLTLAMGVSHWSPSQERDVEEALKEADEEMYEDKKGR